MMNEEKFNNQRKSMAQLLAFLNRSPEVGAVASLAASAATVIDKINPVCQLAGIILGLAIGVLTIYVKLLEIRKLRKSRKNQNL